MPSMSATMIIPTILLLFFAIVLTSKKMGKRKASKRLPPGNMCMPLIGEMIPFLKPQSPATLAEFMKHRISRFGKIFSSHLFGNVCIVSADPEFNKFVLSTKLFVFIFPRAFERVAGKYSFVVLVGDAHKHMRSIMLDFLSTERLRTIFFQDVERIASQISSSWRDGQVISAAKEANNFSLYIMAKQILSMDPSDPEVEKLPKEYHTCIRAFTSLPLYIPGTVYWKALKSRENIIRIFKRELEMRKQKQGSENAGKEKDDFLGWLMQNTDYPPEKIFDLLIGLLFAGHDTTSRAISLSIYFLEKCPQAVQQLREEHMQVVKLKQQRGESKLTLEDFKNMEFTRCVINETLRLGNIGSFLMRKATKDVEYKEFVIPKGSTVFTHIGALHLDPLLYEDPENFNPWRWSSPPGLRVPSSYMPFGGGVRMCPGAELAKLEMAVFLNHLILKYDFKQAKDDHPVTTPFIEFPKGLPIKLQAISTNSNENCQEIVPLKNV